MMVKLVKTVSQIAIYVQIQQIANNVQQDIIKIDINNELNVFKINFLIKLYFNANIVLNTVISVIILQHVKNAMIIIILILKLNNANYMNAIKVNIYIMINVIIAQKIVKGAKIVISVQHVIYNFIQTKINHVHNVFKDVMIVIRRILVKPV